MDTPDPAAPGDDTQHSGAVTGEVTGDCTGAAPSAAAQRHALVARWFDELCEVDVATRTARLAELRAQDAEAAAELESLLAADDTPATALEGSAVVSAGLALPHGLPETLGHFRILGELGRGGMGVVLLAEQDHPHRRVALKVLRPGLLNAELLLRFEREAEALGRLNHPFIAHVYEAGSAESDGTRQAYLSMELVEGETPTAWAQRVSASLPQRLELLRDIADAVQHAHEQGVVHRDLKPSNILVDGNGQPKILDFGVARVVDPDRPAGTAVTNTGEIIGTLQYMSPEQVRGDSRGVDARSDVYSLGVVAYELLSGERPYDTSGLPIHEAARVVLETDPALLGARSQRLRGDVESLVAKALEKEPHRRYATAQELADDIRRHLADEPIHAHPVTATYQLIKFARRHRIAVGGVGAVMLALLLGLIGMAWKAGEAETARGEAVVAQAQAEERMDRALEAQRLMSEFFLAIDPEREGPDARVLHTVERWESALDDETSRAPLVAATLHGTLGDAYGALGDKRKALEHTAKSLELREAHGAEAWELAESLESVGDRLMADGGQDPAETRALLQRAYELRVESHGAKHSRTLLTRMRLVSFDWYYGDRTGVLEQMGETIAALAEFEPPGGTIMQHVRGVYATALTSEGRYEDAEVVLQALLDDVRAAHGEDHLRVAAAQSRLGLVYREMARWGDAYQQLESALAIRRAQLSAGHPQIASSLEDLASLLIQDGRNAEAVPLLEEAVRIERALRDEPGRQLATALLYLGNAELAQGHLEPAAKHLGEALEIALRPEAAVRSTEIATIYESLGILESWRGSLTGALEFQQEANRIRRELPDTNAPDLAVALFNEGTLLRRLGRAEESLEPLTEALTMERQLRGPQHPATTQCSYEVGFAFVNLERYAEALPHVGVAREGFIREYGEVAPEVRHVRVLRAQVLLGLERWSEAEVELLAALEIQTSYPNQVMMRCELSRALIEQGRATEARDQLRPLFDAALAQPLPPPVMERLGNTLARSLLALGDQSGADAVLAQVQAVADG